MPQIETYGGEDFADLSTLLDKGLFEVIRLSNVGEGAAKMASDIPSENEAEFTY